MIATGHGSPYLRPLYAAIVRRRAPASVLDIGAGVGETGRYIRTLTAVPRMDAVEVHPGCVDVIPEGSFDTIWVGDARALPPQGHEMVLCLDVLEHMPKDDGLALVRRHMAAGAHVLVAIPRDATSPARNGGAKDGNPFEAHVSEWSEADFAEFASIDYSDDDHVVMLLEGWDASHHHT